MNYAELGCYRLFEVRLNADRYIEILDNCFLPSINIFKEVNNSTIYQQDGTSCHTAKVSKQQFEDNQISIMPWHGITLRGKQALFLNSLLFEI